MKDVESRSTAERLARTIAPFAMLGLFVAAVTVLYRAFDGYRWNRLGVDLLALGPGPVAGCLAATAVSYVAMTGYDALALRYVEHRMPYRRFALASFVATAFGNSLGASAVVGAALRARVYSAWQVPGFAIGRIIGFNLVTLALGLAVLTAAGLLIDPAEPAAALHLPATMVVVLGVSLLAAVAGYVWWARAGAPPAGWRDWRIDRPSRGLASAQVVLSTAEWATMAAALYAVLPSADRPAFPAFAAAFAVATAAGLLSNLPGGIGVFESTLLLLLGSAVEPTHLAAALVAYRLGYYLLPLAVAAVMLVVLEARGVLARTVPGDAPRGAPGGIEGAAVLTPSVLALGVAGVGLVLLVRGDLPGDTRAPDLSTFTMSLIGVGLLLLAQGLHRRLHGAWASAVGLLLALVVGALQTEPMLSVAAVALLALLLPGRTAFHRTTSLLTAPRGWTWPSVVAALAVTAVWWHDLGGPGGRSTGEATWWAAFLSGQTSGQARVAMALGAVTLLLGGRRMVGSGRPVDGAPDDADLALAAQIVDRAGACTAHLAFTGDKRLHFSRSGTAFLMYQIEGRSWVAMGDPVGDPAEFGDLVWDFVELADRYGGRPVFYGVQGDLTQLYRECGLTVVKLGEEAVVPLAEFSLTGKSRQGMRWRRNGLIKAGCSVEFVPAEQVPPLLGELRAVSDAWLAEGRTREKRFSLGAFDDDYVCRFPVAVVRQAGQVVAFATLWISGDAREVQVDLMRRRPDGPKHVMNYLFVECMLWAKEAGHEVFSLGMAPLSGLRTDATAPFWDRVGNLLWKHGEQFYNFQGLRHFKEQFDPEWRTRFVAAPGGPALTTSMVNVATLVGGGVRGILVR